MQALIFTNMTQKWLDCHASLPPPTFSFFGLLALAASPFPIFPLSGLPRSLSHSPSMAFFHDFYIFLIFSTTPFLPTPSSSSLEDTSHATPTVFSCQLLPVSTRLPPSFRGLLKRRRHGFQKSKNEDVKSGQKTTKDTKRPAGYKRQQKTRKAKRPQKTPSKQRDQRTTKDDKRAEGQTDHRRQQKPTDDQKGPKTTQHNKGQKDHKRQRKTTNT